LLWTNVMHPKDISKPSTDKLHPIMITSGSIGGLGAGLAAGYLFAGQMIQGQQMSTTGARSPATAFIVLPFLIVLCYGSFNS
jgi:hypothetical protein